MARPSIPLTPDIQHRICNAVRVGASINHAARYAGISKRTLQRWRKLAQTEQSGVYHQLEQAIQKARADLAISLLYTIYKAADKHWQAAARLLAYVCPQLYGKVAVKKKPKTRE